MHTMALDKINTKNFKPAHRDNDKTKKCQKNIFTLMFNKAMEEMNLHRILKSKGSTGRLPGKIQLQESISEAIFRLAPTIRKKIYIVNRLCSQILSMMKFHFLLQLEHVIKKDSSILYCAQVHFLASAIPIFPEKAALKNFLIFFQKKTLILSSS